MDVNPGETCKSGKHPRTTANTGRARTGRRFCRACKQDRETERRTKNPPVVKPKQVELSRFEIEHLLSSLGCMVCGAIPTRRGVGDDGAPRWLDTPVTDHGAGCTVGAQREIVQRNRRKSKGVAA